MKAGERIQLLTVGSVATMLCCSKQKVWGMVGRREIDSVLLGRSRRIPITAVERIVEQGLVPAVVR